MRGVTVSLIQVLTDASGSFAVSSEVYMYILSSLCMSGQVWIIEFDTKEVSKFIFRYMHVLFSILHLAAHSLFVFLCCGDAIVADTYRFVLLKTT